MCAVKSATPVLIISTNIRFVLTINFCEYLTINICELIFSILQVFKIVFVSEIRTIVYKETEGVSFVKIGIEIFGDKVLRYLQNLVSVLRFLRCEEC